MSANYEELRWRQEHRATSPLFEVTAKDRNPDSPELNVLMDASRTIRRGDAFDVLIKVTYSSTG
jgi:hypothetical protein